MDVARLLEDLTRVDAYPPAVATRADGPVLVLQTHVSVLFFVGERVYKVKKAVDLGFVDARTLARRRELCEEEVRLNARLAPGVHLGVVPIVAGADGRLVVGGEGEPLEWAVEMVRLPEERMLDALLERGEIDNARLDELARLLARFHAEAATGPGVDEHGAPEAVERNALENFEQTRPFVAEEGGVLTPLQHRFLEERTRAFLAARRALFAERVARGRVRDGHGDLHAGNVCVLPGRIVIYDRIEFAARFRCGDVANDVAFLAMDLELRGFPAFGGYFLRRYAEHAEDPGVLELAPFYEVYRALVRAKVTALTAVDPAVEEPRRGELRLAAMRYAHLAAGHELPPALVLLCGLPATGKSTIGRAIAVPLRAQVLRSDVRRRAGRREDERTAAPYGEGLYAPEKRTAVYAELLADAEQLLARGRSVVVDASFGRRAWRAPFARAAERAGAPAVVLLVEAPEDVVRARLERREREAAAARGRHEPSDAGLAVHERARADFEAPAPDEPGLVLVRASGAAPPEVACARLLDALVRVAGGTS